MSAPSRPRDIRTWLAGEPGLAEMRETFPAEWSTVSRELEAVVETGDPAALAAYARALATGATSRPTGARPTASGLAAATAAEVRRRMAAEAIRGLGVRAATGVTSGRVRFGLVNGKLAQGLFFEGSGLRRKPVSMKRFRLTWPRLSERDRLMPLVQPKGIYCFYSAELVTGLAELIGDRSCLEIAAGDGTLTRFLREAGADVRATDDHSWKAVTFGDDVERIDARKALERDEPQVVLCSWPPAGNPFEAAVFSTPSVELYVVIANRHTSGWGDHAAYARQQGFEREEDERLAALVLPPELESVVWLFRRR